MIAWPKDVDLVFLDAAGLHWYFHFLFTIVAVLVVVLVISILGNKQIRVEYLAAEIALETDFTKISLSSLTSVAAVVVVVSVGIAVIVEVGVVVLSEK